MSEIILCAATGVEAKACRKGIGRAPFEVLQTGMGFERAAAALSARLRVGPRPRLVISTGFAGVRQSGIALGTWILGSGVQKPGETKRVLESEALALALEKAGLRWSLLDYETVGEAEVVESGSAATAVDMESSALAQVAAEAGVGFQILRLTSDTPEHPLPAAIALWGSISSVPKASQKWDRWWRGSRDALAHPRRLGGFLLRGNGLVEQLSEGWAALAANLSL
jgi:hypothetical protein